MQEIFGKVKQGDITDWDQLSKDLQGVKIPTSCQEVLAAFIQSQTSGSKK